MCCCTTPCCVHDSCVSNGLIIRCSRARQGRRRIQPFGDDVWPIREISEGPRALEGARLGEEPERSAKARLLGGSAESSERERGIDRGAGGAKATGRGEYGRGPHAPDAEPHIDMGVSRDSTVYESEHRRRRRERFASLLPLIDLERLTASYLALKRHAAS